MEAVVRGDSAEWTVFDGAERDAAGIQRRVGGGVRSEGRRGRAAAGGGREGGGNGGAVRGGRSCGADGRTRGGRTQVRCAVNRNGESRDDRPGRIANTGESHGVTYVKGGQAEVGGVEIADCKSCGVLSGDRGSKAMVQGGRITGSGDAGVACSWAGQAEVRGVVVSKCGGHGLYRSLGSSLQHSGCQVSGCRIKAFDTDCLTLIVLLSLLIILFLIILWYT